MRRSSANDAGQVVRGTPQQEDVYRGGSTTQAGGVVTQNLPRNNALDHIQAAQRDLGTDAAHIAGASLFEVSGEADPMTRKILERLDLYHRTYLDALNVALEDAKPPELRRREIAEVLGDSQLAQAVAKSLLDYLDAKNSATPEDRERMAQAAREIFKTTGVAWTQKQLRTDLGIAEEAPHVDQLVAEVFEARLKEAEQQRLLREQAEAEQAPATTILRSATGAHGVASLEDLDRQFPRRAFYPADGDDAKELYLAAATYVSSDPAYRATHDISRNDLIKPSWVTDPAQWKHLQHVLNKENRQGLPGLPNYAFNPRKRYKQTFDGVEEALRDSRTPGFKTRHSAMGLSQQNKPNRELNYPRGDKGTGQPFDEAVGYLTYVAQRYRTPKAAATFHDIHHWY